MNSQRSRAMSNLIGMNSLSDVIFEEEPNYKHEEVKNEIKGEGKFS